MRLRMLFAVVGVGALAAVPLWAAPSATSPSAGGADANLPIQQVTLYTNGVGYFERSGMVDGDATQTLLFPVDQINDVLKSLVLLDNSGGSIQPVTYAAQDPLARRLQNFSVDLSDNPDRATLLNRLRGTSVTVTAPGGVVTGTIVGVQTQTVTLPNNGGTTDASSLNLMADDGLHTIALADVSALKINDPAVNAELAQALTVVAQGRDAGKRPVTLAFDGHGRRQVTVGYLTQTPLWQTTYRLVLGKTPILQGWALVQNTGQDDWNNIHLTLVSGQPISFIQDLYTPQYINRPVVAPRIASTPTPQAYAGNLDQVQLPVTPQPAPTSQSAGSRGGFGGGGGGFGGYGGGIGGIGGGIGGIGGGPVAAAPEEAANIPGGAVEQYNSAFATKNNTTPFNSIVNQSMATQGAKLGTALFSYAIKVPVTVPRGQSAMIPFFSGPIQVEPVAIYDPSVQPDHPLTGARIKNTSGLHLMGGPLTVFDTGANGDGYVGDALIDDTEPNQTRLISYAIDLGVDAKVEGPGQSIQSVKVVLIDGTVETSAKEQATTQYTFKNNTNAPQTIVVEHPDPGDGWTLLEPKNPTEKTADTLRFDVPVPAGGSKQFTVREERTNITGDQIANDSDDVLIGSITNGQASPAVKAAIKEVVAKRQVIAQTQAKLDDVTARITAIGTGQSRIRDNMKALSQSSALYRRYVTELNAQETALDGMQTQHDALQTQLTQQKNALSDYLAHLSVQ